MHTQSLYVQQQPHLRIHCALADIKSSHQPSHVPTIMVGALPVEGRTVLPSLSAWMVVPQVGEARRMHEEGSRRAVDAHAGSTVELLLSAGCNPRSGPWVTPTCGKVLAQQRTTGWTTSRCHKRTSNVSALPPSSPATPKGTAYCGTTGNCWLLVRP